MENNETDIIILVDEEGKEHEFELIDAIELDEERYAFLAPVEQSGDFEEDEVIILKVKEDETGEEVLLDIEDDDEWEKVASAWQKLIDEEDDEE